MTSGKNACLWWWYSGGSFTDFLTRPLSLGCLWEFSEWKYFPQIVNSIGCFCSFNNFPRIGIWYFRSVLFLCLRNLEVQWRIHKGSLIIPTLSQINQIPHIDTYLFKVHCQIFGQSFGELQQLSHVPVDLFRWYVTEIGLVGK